jgi:phage/plasmid-like protein (TIGR03299 family)
MNLPKKRSHTMANYGMRELGDTHGHGQRIVTMEKAYGESLGFGKTIQDGMTGQEILEATETDWEVEKVPALANTPSGPVEIPNTFSVIRTDTNTPFGQGRCVGANYTPYQNREVVAFAESMMEAADGDLKFEAGGYLKEGAIVWYQARIPHAIEVRATEHGSDTVEPFIFLLTAHDGTMSTTGMFTAHRPFCNNQISSLLRKGQNKITVRHTKTMHTRMDEAQRVLQGALGFFEAHVEEMRDLDKQAMTHKEMREFAEKLIGETEEALGEADRTISDAQQARRIAQRDRLTGLFNDGLGNVGRSRFDALQAVTEFADHHRPQDGDASRLRRLVLQAPDQDIKVRAARLLR